LLFGILSNIGIQLSSIIPVLSSKREQLTMTVQYLWIHAMILVLPFPADRYEGEINVTTTYITSRNKYPL
jgi:hypothetical protein